MKHYIQDLLLQDPFKFISECGYLKPAALVKAGDIPKLIKQVCMEYVLIRSSLEMQQFIEGLNTQSLLYLLKSSSTVMKKLFVYENQGISVQKLQNLLVSEFSPKGSNVREEEEAIIMNWNDYLRDIEE